MADKKLGKILHYYDKIGVAVVDVLSPFKVGDKIKISGHDNQFVQEVVSMQEEHKAIQKVKKGQKVGLKVDAEVKEGDEVYKAE